MKYTTFLFFLVFAGAAFRCDAQQDSLRNFIIKENLLKNNQVAVIAADSNELPDTAVSGTYTFSVNGFRQDLDFHNGVAVIHQPIERSTFIYLKCEGETHTASRLYYVIKKDDNLSTYPISWLLLALIPAGIVVVALLFRRFILFAVLILAALFYFNHQEGLHFTTFFETIFDGLKALLSH